MREERWEEIRHMKDEGRKAGRNDVHIRKDDGRKVGRMYTKG